MPMGGMLIGGMGAGVLGGGLGQALSQGDRNAALNLQQGVLANWEGLQPPMPAEMSLALQKYQLTGQMDPQLAQVIQQQQSQMGKIQTDPALRQAQMDALGQLQQEGLSGGLTLQDQAALQGAIQQNNANARGQQGAIMNQYAQQGLGGSGLQLQAQLMGMQGQNQQNANATLNAAAQSRQRALDAIMGAGQLGGQIQSSEFGQQAEQVRAQDAINQFNAANAQRTGNQNAAWQNQAQQYNLNAAQNVANQNTQLSNAQQQYNKQLYQQQYQNQLQKMYGEGSAAGTVANTLNNNAQNTQQMYSGMGGAVGQGMIGYGMYNAQQQQNQGNNQGGNQWGFSGSQPIANSTQSQNNWDYTYS